MSRNTVIRAYETLVVEGYVESRPASGISSRKSAGNALKPSDGLAPVARRCDVAYDAEAAIAASCAERGRQGRTAAFDFFPGRANASFSGENCGGVC